MTGYDPNPIDTSGAPLPAALRELTELLARNVHDNWAKQRLGDGWRLGPRRDDARKEHPSLVPYEDLSEAEKDYDRLTAIQTVRAIISLGYRIERTR